MGRGCLEKRIFLTLLKRGDTIFDIGANLGHFTRLFSDLAGRSGSVHAFEPIAGTFQRLEKMMGASAAHPNYSLHNHGLGETLGIATFHQPDNDCGQVSMRPQNIGSWENPAVIKTHECRIEVLDEITRPLTRLDFIKCDVEGAELHVLRGARET